MSLKGTIRAALPSLMLTGCTFFHAQHSSKPAMVLNVPFFPNDSDQCGPSALASVMAFWGEPADPVLIKKEIYLAFLKGSLPIDLLLAAQHHGFKAHVYNGSVSDVRTELGLGHPLVVFLNRGFDLLPIGHFVVITGIDEDRHGFIIHSGMDQNKFVPYKQFMKNWDKTERSTLLILPPRIDGQSSHVEN